MLDKILEDLVFEAQSNDGYNVETSKAQAKAAIKLELEKIVGEDEKELEIWEDDYHSRSLAIEHRNELRAEIRSRIKEL